MSIQISKLSIRPFVFKMLIRRDLCYYQISDPKELSSYQARYTEASGNEIPEDYLQSALVYQFYKGCRPVAGFILNTVEHASLRYFSYLNENVQQALLFDEDLVEADFLEITSIWKFSELSASESRTFYSIMLKQAYRQAQLSGKKLLLGGSVIKSIKKLQQRLMTRIIYHGPIDPQRRKTVREQEKQPLLKLYIVPVAHVRWRVAVVLWKRYLGINIQTLFLKNKA